MGTTNFDIVDASGGLKVSGTEVITSAGAIVGDIQATAGSISATELATTLDLSGKTVTLNGGANDTTITETADGAVGAALNLKQVSASPAANDEVGIVNFIGKDSGGADTTYAKFAGLVEVTTAGSESGLAAISAAKGDGTLAVAGIFSHDGSNSILKVGDGTSNGVVSSLGAGSLTLEADTGTASIVLTNTVALTGAEIHSTITASSGAGAVPVTGRIHQITTTATGDALTLANGTAGQRLTLLYVAETAGADTAVLTPTTLAGGSTITFNALGDSAELVYSATGGWYVVGLGGTATVA